MSKLYRVQACIVDCGPFGIKDLKEYIVRSLEDVTVHEIRIVSEDGECLYENRAADLNS